VIAFWEWLDAMPAPAFFGSFVVAMLVVAIANEVGTRDLQR
jgi:hypothetical protein